MEDRDVMLPTPTALLQVIGVAIVVLVTGCRSSPPAAEAQPTIADVIDGDTVVVVLAGRRETVRLLGIDTPETVHPTLPQQCFGAEASAALHNLLPAGTTVRLERDAQARDHYGRLLLYLYRHDDDLFVNEWLVEQGLADTSFYEPNTAFASTLREARRRARTSGAGLWGSCEGADQPLN